MVLPSVHPSTLELFSSHFVLIDFAVDLKEIVQEVLRAAAGYLQNGLGMKASSTRREVFSTSVFLSHHATTWLTIACSAQDELSVEASLNIGSKCCRDVKPSS